MKKVMLLATMLLGFCVNTWANTGPEIDAGSTAWMLTSTALVLLMVPGLAMFYGGLVRSKNVLGTMMHSFAAMGVMSVLWVIVGYSMCFGDSILGGLFGWNSDYVLLNGIDDVIMEGGVPELVFSMFQGKFAIITPALIAGAFAERVKFKGYLVFIALWGIIVYNPLCHWVWSAEGFLHHWGAAGAIDFAGGTVVHISAGVSGLVAAIYLGARRGYPHRQQRPNNLVMTMMGVGLLWVGWFGFNAGSSINSGLDTAQALTATQVAGAAGALMWVVIELIHHGKGTALGFASGILAGLVAVTPAAGVVQPVGAMILGAISSVICYGALIMKDKIGFDDSLDAFGIHGVGGIVGAVLLSFFIRDAWMADAAANTADGIWTSWDQFWVQAVTVVIAIGYSIVTTIAIIWVVEKLIGLKSSDEEEMMGMDHAYHGERGYGMMNPN